jgi:zinc transport system permease protein
MLEFLQYGFMQRAILSGLLVAIICATLGVFLVLRRMSLIGDGFGHIGFGGIAAGLFLKISPLISAVVYSIFCAIGIQKLREARVYGDAALTIFFSASLALAILLISLQKGANIDLESYLFGNILLVSSEEIVLLLGFFVLLLIFLFIYYQKLLHITFDEEGAKVSGIAVEKINFLFMIFIAIAIVFSIKIVGLLLVSSFIAIPATTALRIAKNFKETILIANIIAIISTISGILISYYAGIAAGSSIVFLLIGAFLLSILKNRK